MKATYSCCNCGKTGLIYRRPTPTSPRTDIPTRSTSLHYQDFLGKFCSLRCAASYGIGAAYFQNQAKKEGI